MCSKKPANVQLAVSSQCLDFNTGCHSLLECLEQQKYTPPFQCREGYCGACRVEIISGEVTYNQEPLAFVREGEILLCCCKPDGDINIKI